MPMALPVIIVVAMCYRCYIANAIYSIESIFRKHR